ncbi:catalase family peroxidase [Mycobacteroides saopaulense]|uniref:Catalase-related peroxidase n=1 Tax=Mycobacteroides saopaulense TaxID=1578165 RepID=A0ABX3BXS4_9MYCO|nr:catalase family peroxidase [Mycobacteroides saopaulense]OHT86688.1 catalase [Mycobacteroides saopaulense]OHU08545.1 catalase [Mycobacteroides saopaulense]
MVAQKLDRRMFVGLVAAGAVTATGLGGFLALEGRAGSRLTGRSFIDLFEKTGGTFVGYRRNHAKAIAVSGRFESNGAGAQVSSASVFTKGVYPVAGRFSVGGQNPHQPDTGSGQALALDFSLPGGEQWRTAMAAAPVFMAPTPEMFYGLLAARTSGDKDRVSAFMRDNPPAAAAQKLIEAAPKAASFAEASYSSLNTFIFVNKDGARTPVRWRVIPDGNAAGAPVKNGPNWMFEALAQRMRRGELRYRLLLQVGIPGVDPTHDPTLPWPPDREQIDVGTLILGHAIPQEQERIRDTNFDPTVLPKGIEISDDPILAARAAVYAESYRRRARETPAPIEQFGQDM